MCPKALYSSFVLEHRKNMKEKLNKNHISIVWAVLTEKIVSTHHHQPKFVVF